MLFLSLLLAVGLFFIAISKKLDTDIERMDANFTGDLLMDEEERTWYYFDRKKKERNSKGAKYLGRLLIFWCVVWVAVILLDLIF